MTSGEKEHTIYNIKHIFIVYILNLMEGEADMKQGFQDNWKRCNKMDCMMRTMCGTMCCGMPEMYIRRFLFL